jgi:hemerythrin
MPFMDWDRKYVLGIDEVDRQHKHLFEIVNHMHDAVTSGADQSAVTTILDELIHYTVEHFETEENMFREHEYPGYEKHRLEHNELAARVLDLQRRLREGSATVSFDVLEFLSDWLADHTLGSDQEFAAFLKSTAE